MSASLRPAAEQDFAAIAAIYRHHVLHGLATFEEHPPDAAELLRRFADIEARDLPWLVAAAPDGAVLGYAYAGPYRLRSAYRFTVEDSVYLHPDAARQGLGRRLIEALIDRTTSAGMRQMIAVIGDSANAASIGVHRACGFAMTGTLHAVGFKFGRWVDGVIMQRPLGPSSSTLPFP
jgi:phosphinothricin acetyltransferase